MAEEKKVSEKARPACKVDGCKRPYQAKGYCNVHYQKWRRGELAKARFNTCNFGVNKLKHGEKKECLHKVFLRGLCEEHYNSRYGKKPAEAKAEA